MSFSPMRLGIARKRRLLNKKRFAELAGVAPQIRGEKSAAKKVRRTHPGKRGDVCQSVAVPGRVLLR